MGRGALKPRRCRKGGVAGSLARSFRCALLVRSPVHHSLGEGGSLDGGGLHQFDFGGGQAVKLIDELVDSFVSLGYLVLDGGEVGRADFFGEPLFHRSHCSKGAAWQASAVDVACSESHCDAATLPPISLTRSPGLPISSGAPTSANWRTSGPRREERIVFMETKNTQSQNVQTLRTLPGDDVRQMMWRFADRYDLQMLVQSSRRVARGPVARMVAEGARNSHEWTAQKAQLLKAMDESGVTAAFMELEHGGFIAGPKNLALALVAFELSWVDGGAATGSLAGNLALAPIHECGTPEQVERYMSLAAPAKPGETRMPWRGAFALTEPLPYVGVETGLLSGKMRIAEWKKDEEPILQVEKRGRFITNMGFANFVTAAVDSADDRIKGSCMVILEETDPGTFDRGVPTRKLVHQLSSTRDPVFSLRVPASRIIGGYTIKEGVIVPKYSHGEVIEAVFRRTRVTVGLMTAAKLLSAVEPVIRYQRGRFRGGDAAAPGSPRYELGLQMKEDVLHRLVDVWATGEAAASLGFAAARLFDEVDPLEVKKDEVFAAQKIEGGRAQFRAMMAVEKDALELIRLSAQAEEKRDAKRFEALDGRYAGAVCGARFAGQRAVPCREALEHGPRREHDARGRQYDGRLRHHGGLSRISRPQVDGRAVGGDLRRPRGRPAPQLSITMGNELFLAQFRQLDCRPAPPRRRTQPGTGAVHAGHRNATVAVDVSASTDRQRRRKARSSITETRQGVTFSLADALAWLLAVAPASPRRPRTRSQRPGKSRRSPTACAGSSISTPTSARSNALALPAKSAASAPNWCSATPPPGLGRR